MSTQVNRTFRSTGTETRHCKEDALSERAFERMYAASFELDDYRAIESRLILFLAGRLGMRVGEIRHLSSEWIDWRRQMIEIPRHEPCNMGRDNNMCGYCRQAARRLTEYHDDIGMDEAGEMQWKPKTEAAAREIPYAVSPRTEMVIERYFDSYERLQISTTGISRRVDRLADLAEDVDPESTYPHCLRATAASHWAARGLNAVALKSMMGWSDFNIALKYIEESGERTAKALESIQS